MSYAADNLKLNGLLLLLSLLSACSSQPVRTGAYIVKSGDTLYSIAWRHNVDYHELAHINHLGRDYRIYAGQTLRFSAGTATKPSQQVAATTKAPIFIASHLHWQWPVISKHYAATTRPNGGKGLIINGIEGQDINAAASGRVVYAGNGLLGYGQLLIIKHDEVFLSAYGHTQRLLVHEGDQVAAGQAIATMGNGSSGMPQLYFEIRSNGIPLSPLSILPQQ